MRTLGIWAVTVSCVILFFMIGCNELPALTQRSGVGSPKSSLAQQRAEMIKRRVDLRQRAIAAIDLDGTPGADRMAVDVAGCPMLTAFCKDKAEKVASTCPTAAFVGMAIQAVDGDPDKAEELIIQAERAAKENADTKKAKIEKEAEARHKAEQDAADRKAKAEKEAADRKAKVDAEEQAFNVQNDECKKNRKTCIDKCNEKKTMACAALGALLLDEKRYDESKRYFTMACNDGILLGCTGAKLADEDKAASAARVESAWSSFASATDDLTKKRYMQATLLKLGDARSAMNARKMGAFISATIKEGVCPARKDFLALSSQADLSKRIKDHCDNDPPVVMGLSGRQVALSDECRAAFSASCP